MSRRKSDERAVINLRVLSAMSLFAASKEEARFYLRGVCIEVDERGATYAATDGVRLMAYRDEHGPDEDDNTLSGVFIIPTQRCKSIKLDKEDDGRATLSLAHDADDRLTISHAESFTDVTFVPIEGTFPDWRKVIPRRAPSAVPAQFNLKQLGDLAKFSKELDLGPPFISHNGEAPAAVWFSGHMHVIGIVMPVKATDERNREAPQWARRGPEREQGDIEDAPPVFDDYDPETGEVLDRAEVEAAALDSTKLATASETVQRAVKRLGTPVELTEEEKKKGYACAWLANDGTRVALGFRHGRKKDADPPPPAAPGHSERQRQAELNQAMPGDIGPALPPPAAETATATT